MALVKSSQSVRPCVSKTEDAGMEDIGLDHSFGSQLIPDLLRFGFLAVTMLLGLFSRPYSHGLPIFGPYQTVAGELPHEVLVVPNMCRIAINVSDSCVHVLEISTKNRGLVSSYDPKNIALHRLIVYVGAKLSSFPS